MSLFLTGNFAPHLTCVLSCSCYPKGRPYEL